MLLQAMLSVNDMFMTSRANVHNIFLEDVENFFLDHDVRYTENVSFTGKSGFSHKFDFIVPRSKKSPERVIRTINNPNKDTSASVLFAWNDTKETRRSDSMLYTFLNDADKGVNKDVLSAFHEYDVKTVLWSQREKYIDELIA